jgi:outer membrane lipoprotein carrier protein
MWTANAKVSTPASGTFLFARPGKFIWTYVKPYEQVLQADGEKLYIYDKDLNQVTVKKLGDALGSSPAAILFGSNDLEKNFTLSEAGTRDGLEWLKAVPKTKDSSFEQIDRPAQRPAGSDGAERFWPISARLRCSPSRNLKRIRH